MVGVPSPRPSPNLPLGFAHRGARAERRDNTLASFARALELGAEGLESDVWVTADGQAVLDHDGLVRDGWRRRPIATRPADRLPAHIPRLADLYARCGSAYQLSLDVKDPTAAAAAVAVAEAGGAGDRLWLCSPDVGLLASWRNLWAKVRLVASVRRARLTPAAVAGLAEDGIDVVNLRERDWDQALVDQVHAAGMLAFGWDAQTPHQLDRLLGLGVDGVYSDHVARMEHALARHRPRS
jgi:glycerophosphoryl diester phosphodiesterase